MGTRRDLSVAVRSLRDLRLPAALPGAARGRRQPRARRRARARAGRAARGRGDRDARRARGDARDRQYASADAGRICPAPTNDLAPTGCGPRRSSGCGTRPSCSSTSASTGERRVDDLPLEEERGLPAPPRTGLRRRVARPRRPPLLRAGARARVPVRLVLPRRRRHRAVPSRVGARPRRRARHLRGVRRLGRRAPAPAPAACTSTTTPPTSAPRCAG